VSRPQTGEVVALSAAGAVVRRVEDPDEPEGLEVAAGGRLFLAEQRTNRVMLLDPDTGTRTPVVSVPGARGLDVGIDGIGVDASTSRLLIPDSPEGTLLTATETGAALTTVARGLGRPVAAAPLDGAILVAEENPPGLVRVSDDGSVQAVVRSGLRAADDVVVLHGVVYVTDLATGAVDAVDPSTGALRTLLSGVPSPQGLATTDTGGLVVSDSRAGELVALEPCR
jgi:DNA-binding beta-propeller fold protein YncE